MAHRFRHTTKLALGEEITIIAYETEQETFKTKNGLTSEYYYLTWKDEKDRYTTSRQIGAQLRIIKFPARVKVVKDGVSMKLESID